VIAANFFEYKLLETLIILTRTLFKRIKDFYFARYTAQIDEGLAYVIRAYHILFL